MTPSSEPTDGVLPCGHRADYVQNDEVTADEHERCEGLARDPMIDKLFELFRPATPQPPSCFQTPEYARAMLTGVPIEQIADAVNRRYLAEASRAISQEATRSGHAWTPSRWVLVVPLYLFHGWERINGVPLIRSSHMPDWTLWLMRREFDLPDLAPGSSFTSPVQWEAWPTRSPLDHPSP